MGLAVYVPARVGEGYFTDWTAPASGSTDTGKVWVWNNATSKYEAAATLTNYTLVTPTIASTGWANANHAHTGSTTGGQLDHGSALTGLGDNDHPQYLLASGVSGFGASLIDDADAATARNTLGLGTMATATEMSYLLASGARAGAVSQAQTFTVGVRSQDFMPPSDSASAFRFWNAGQTVVLASIDTTGSGMSIAGRLNVTKIAGDTSPNVNVTGGTHPYMYFQNGVCFGKMQVIDGANFFILGTESNHPFYFYTNNSPRGLISAAGQWRIGDNSAPNNMLDVFGVVQCDGLRIDVTPAAETPTATHTIIISANGTNYKLLCVAA